MVIIPSKKTGKPVPLFFKNGKAVDAERDLLTLCKPHRPSQPIESPLILKVDFVWPWRASEPNWRKALGRAPHTSKPDCSNIVKQIEDCMTKLGFWLDDGQVADLQVTKAWGNAVGIYVCISEIPEATKPSRPVREKTKRRKSSESTAIYPNGANGPSVHSKTDGVFQQAELL